MPPRKCSKHNFPNTVNVQAYADDIAIPVAAEIRTRLVNLAAESLVPVLRWGGARGLSFSYAKYEALVTKGNLEPGFTIPFGNARIKTKMSVKYLGKRLDQYWNFNSHIESVYQKNVELFSKLRETWVTIGETRERTFCYCTEAYSLPALRMAPTFGPMQLHRAQIGGNCIRFRDAPC